MIALLSTIWPFILGAAGILWGLFMHWRTNSKVSAAVEETKATTETQVRQDVANETATAAVEARSDALNSRQASDTEAASTATQGDTALDDALKAGGNLRD